MRERAKQLVSSGLDRAVAARGLQGADAMLARSDALDWARLRARALRRQRGVIGGLGVVVTRPGRAELRSLEVLVAGPGEVTVELLASAISPGTERAQWLRLPNARPALPFVPGYSAAGRVVARGAGVEGMDPGTLVAVPRARHASVMTVPAGWVTPVPPGVRLADAALVYLAIIAGYGVRRAGGLTGEPVCVIGAGSIGALAHRLLMLRGPGDVTVVATSPRRKAAAMRAGATSFRTSAEGIEGIAAAVVIDATGDPDAMRSAVAAARPGGIVVLLGSPRGVTPDAGLAEVQSKGLSLVGAHVSALATEAKAAEVDPFAELSREFLDALAGGHLEAADLSGEPGDPREAGLIYRRLAAGESVLGHLDWSLLGVAERVRHGRLLALPALRPSIAPVRGEALELRAQGARRRPLRFAVIGCGDIGLTNARAIARARNAEVTLCHDPAPALAGAAAAECGGEAADSLEQALDPGRADAVFLSVPHDLHVALTVRAADAGLHVVVEKPLATDLAGAREAVSATDSAGVALSACFPFRYEAHVQTAARLIRAGALGELRGATVAFHADKPPSYWLGGFSGRAPSDWRASRRRAGGGVLIMNLTHYIDQIRHLAGGEPAWVAGCARTDEGAEVEDAISLAVGFLGGAVGSVSASASTRGAPANRFEIWGDLGTVRLEPDPAIYTERAVGGIAPGRWTPLVEDATDRSREVFVERFCSAVGAGRTPDVSPADSLAVQAFVDAAYRAVESGESVAIATAQEVMA